MGDLLPLATARSLSEPVHMQLLPQKSSLKPKPASDKKKKPVEEDPDSVQI